MRYSNADVARHLMVFMPFWTADGGFGASMMGVTRGFINAIALTPVPFPAVSFMALKPHLGLLDVVVTTDVLGSPFGKFGSRLALGRVSLSSI